MVDWIAVDWRTAEVRVWIMGSEGMVERLIVNRGAAGLDGSGYEAALGSLIAAYLDDDDATDILITGEPAAPGRWADAPARAVPCTPPGGPDCVAAPVHDPRLNIRLVTGVMQRTPAGLMQADALRISGLLGKDSDFDGVICLAGARSHWVQVSAGEIVSFQGFLTMDMAMAICGALELSIAGHRPGEGFDAMVEDVMARPQALAQKIGSIEAQKRLSGAGDADLADGIFGAYLGAELAATKPYWLGQRVALIGSEDMVALYHPALEAQGIVPEVYDEEALLISGFQALT